MQRNAVIGEQSQGHCSCSSDANPGTGPLDGEIVIRHVPRTVLRFRSCTLYFNPQNNSIRRCSYAHFKEQHWEAQGN